jgi:predicted alpha/beta-hydrolase family hydrolase
LTQNWLVLKNRFLITVFSLVFERDTDTTDETRIFGGKSMSIRVSTMASVSRPASWVAATFLVLLTAPIFATGVPPGFAEIAIAEGLNPTAMALAPDGSIFF